MKKQVFTFFLGFLFGAGILWVLFSASQDPSSDRSDGDLAPAEASAEVVDAQVTAIEQFPYEIAGMVEDDQSQPIGGVEVNARSEDGVILRSTTTNEEGRFVVQNVPMHLYTMEARTLGYEGVTRLGVVPDGPPLTLTLTARNELAGRAMFEGQPASGLMVLYGSPGVFPPGQVRTDDSGRFLIPDVSDWGGLELIALGPEYGTGFLRAPTGRGELELTVREARPLTLEIVDSVTDAPITEGLVALSIGQLHTLSVATPITSGNARVDGIPDGTVHLRVRALRHLEWSGAVTHTGETIRIELEPGTLITGVVVGPEGIPLAGARLRAEVRDNQRLRWHRGRDVDVVLDRLYQADGAPILPRAERILSGEDGTFSIGGIPAGRVRIFAALDGYGGDAPEALEVDGQNDVTGVTITLESESR